MVEGLLLVAAEVAVVFAQIVVPIESMGVMEIQMLVLVPPNEIQVCRGAWLSLEE